MQAEIFKREFANKLKTIEIDVDKKIFKINGEDFSDCTTDFTIYFEPCDGFKICVSATTEAKFMSYCEKKKMAVSKDTADEVKA